MPAILLIRHGENDYVGKRLAGRLPGVHLNEKGRLQAVGLAERLKTAPIKAIYSSPLERAVETAGPLAEMLGIDIKLEENLLEVDFGTWQGKTGKQMRRMKLWKQVQETPSTVRYPNGESFQDAQLRMVKFLDQLVTQYEEADLIASFTHCDVIRLVLAHYMDMPLDAFQRLVIDTASISLVYLGQGRPTLAFMNRTANLIEAEPPGK